MLKFKTKFSFLLLLMLMSLSFTAIEVKAVICPETGGSINCGFDGKFYCGGQCKTQAEINEIQIQTGACIDGNFSCDTCSCGTVTTPPDPETPTWTLSGNDLYPAVLGNNVGIGTSTIGTYKLVVDGVVNLIEGLFMKGRNILATWNNNTYLKANNGSIEFQPVDGQTKMIITNTGNVGMGTSTASYLERLRLKSINQNSVVFTIEKANSGNSLFEIWESSGEARIMGKNTVNSNGFFITASSTANSYVLSSLSLGTTAIPANYKLNVNGNIRLGNAFNIDNVNALKGRSTANDFKILSNDAETNKIIFGSAQHDFYTGGQLRFSVLNSGVSTTGFILRNGSQGAGKVLTSDASGVANWTQLNFTESDPTWNNGGNQTNNINRSGQVALGNTSNVADTNVRFIVGGNNNDNRIRITSLPSGGGQAELNLWANDSSNIMREVNLANYRGTFNIWTSGLGANAFSVLQNGNVGIGTTDPGSRLQINNSGQEAFKIVVSGSHTPLRISTSTNNISTIFQVHESGRVGIGLGGSNPNAKLDLRTATNEEGLHIDVGTSSYSPINVKKGSATMLQVHQGGNVSIGAVTSDTGSKLQVEGDIQASGSICANGGSDCLTAGSTLPTGSVNQTLRYDGSKWVASSYLYNSDSESGIDAGNSNSMFRFKQYGIEKAAIYTLNGSQDLHLRGRGNLYIVASSSAADAADLFVRSDGNVGIGTTDPGSRLQINNSGQEALRIVATGLFTPLRISTTTNSNTTLFQVHETGRVGIGLGDSNPNARLEIKASGNEEGLHIEAGNFSPINVKKGSATMLQVHQGGNVSIGAVTSDTGSKLQVEGDIQASGSIGIGTTPSRKFHLLENNSNAVLAIQRTDDTPANNSAMLLLSGAGINTIYSRNNSGITDLQDRDFSIVTGSGNERLRIKADGKVGIGISSPTTELDINGQIKIRGGGYGDGKVLTSDASGLASWQTPNNSQWTTSGNDIYYNNGDVGIGTVSPDRKLHILDASDTFLSVQRLGNTTNLDDASLNGVLLFAVQSGAQGNVNSIYSRIKNNGGARDFRIMIDSNEALRIDTDRNVGIGNTTPDAKLRIDPLSATEGLKIRLPASSPYSAINVQNSANTDLFRVNQYGNVTAAGSICANGGSDCLTAGSTLPPGSANQTLRYNGSIWVASSNLYNSGSEIGINGIGSNNSLIRLQDDGVETAAIYTLNDANDLRLRGKGGVYIDGGGGTNGDLFVKSDGNVGIGNTTPDAKLRIDPLSATEGLKIRLPASSPYSAINVQNSANTDLFRVNQYGQLSVPNPSSGYPAIKVGRITGQPSIKAENANDWLILDGGKVGLNYYQNSDVIIANGGGNTFFGGTTKTNSHASIMTSGEINGNYLHINGTGDNNINGKLKIGSTATPSEALDVAGNIKASGSICSKDGCIGGTGVGSTNWNEITNKPVGMMSSCRRIATTGERTLCPGGCNREISYSCNSDEIMLSWGFLCTKPDGAGWQDGECDLQRAKLDSNMRTMTLFLSVPIRIDGYAYGHAICCKLDQ